MPSQLPSSFASAAAGQNRDGRGGRGDATRGGNSGEWPRRDGRSVNGTLTFRRSSTTPANHLPAQASSDLQTAPVGDSVNAAYDSSASHRYSRDELLEIYKNSGDTADIDVTSLFHPDWNPSHANGSSSRTWGGRHHDAAHAPQDPNICWDADGNVMPMGVQEMTAEERDLFNSDVNSTVKPPQQSKEGNPASSAPNGRKTSVSHSSVSNFPLSSPSTGSRPGTRRRETTDTNPFSGGGLASPTASQRFSRDDPSPWFTRKSTDAKDAATEEPEEEPQSAREAPSRTLPFGLTRANTAGNSGFAGAASIWGGTAPGSASASGGFGNFTMPGSANKGFGAGRGESRLAHLIPKDNSEASTTKTLEGSAGSDLNSSSRTRQRTDTDPFGGISPAQPTLSPSASQEFGTLARNPGADFGFGSLNLGSLQESQESAAFRSPVPNPHDDEDETSGLDRNPYGGNNSEQTSKFSTLSRGFASAGFEGSDRSQTSSAGGKGLAGLNNLTTWPAGPSLTTPGDAPGFGGAFGGGIFGPDLQSPSMAAFGGAFGSNGGPSSTGTGSLRGSKLGSLFPAAMQAQVPTQDQELLGDSVPDIRQGNPLGAIGRGAIGSQARGPEIIRGGPGNFDEVFSPTDLARSVAAFPASDLGGQTAIPSAASAQVMAAPGFAAGPVSVDPAGAQSRTMVMPDRMRWVYMDPQGSTQGPFTGLEMNDWYKANFFSPDLRVKKVEDPDFEPLGQLIRRIGNSREPFLVPQIGIAHGPPAQSGPFSPGDSSRGVVPPLVGAFPSYGRTLTAEEQNNLERRKQEEQFLMARQREFLAQQQATNRMQMPGSGALHHHSSAHSLQSHPSFGSMTSPIGASQASIGAIGSNFFDSSTAAAMGASSDRLSQDLTAQERQILANLQSGRSGVVGFAQQPIGGSGNDGGLRGQLPGVDQLHKDSQGFSARLKEFNELRAQRDAEDAAHGGLPGLLEESEHDISPLPQERAAEVIREVTQGEASSDGQLTATQQAKSLSLTQQVQQAQAAAAAAAAAATVPQEDPWGKVAEAGMPMPFPPPKSATPLPAPTAQRTKSTLPEQYLEIGPDGTEAVPSQMPQAQQQAAKTAPWARGASAEPQKSKGPSLKAIQAAEAKKAAKAEEAAAALRRAALEQEATAIREQERFIAAAATAGAGLPTTSTWGSGSSPVGNASQVGSAWAKPGSAVKPNQSGPQSAAAASKKTLADIQREEEARKQKARDAQLQAAAVSGAAMGKRYADLAGKTGAPPGLAGPGSAATSGQTVGAGWSTVGAGGKVKIPTGPAAQGRTASGSVKTPATTATTSAAPVVKSVSHKAASTKDGGAAMDEFNKWLRWELSRGITPGIEVSNVASTLMILPLEPQIITEVIYTSSTTMDARHFAEEFIRRKKLADKGVVEKASTASATGSIGGDSSSGSKNVAGAAAKDAGGWSEVAKKSSGSGSGSASTGSGQRDDGGIPGASVKVVQGKRKGRK